MPLFTLRFFVFLSAWMLPCCLQAQQVDGIIYNEYNQPLPFTSVTQKGTSSGVTANQSGQFKLRISSGKSVVLVFQHVGYESIEQTLTVATDTFLTIQMKPPVLKEVIVQSGGENPAYRVIRKAIQKRSYYNNQVDA
ncbi:MAG: carboxypeptidase-like regulatory domain-containing protein, partial [Ferruginibacter sp.]